MKASILFSGFKRKMVRIFFVVIVSLSPSLPVSSNPIAVPSTILEIYLNNGSWQIELLNNEFYSDITNLDDLWLVGQHDTAQFISGILFPVGEVVVISDYSLQIPMTIEQSGDDIALCEKIDDYFNDIGRISWGIHWWDISAPVGQESIAYQWFSLPYDEYFIWEVKEKPETIGSFPWQVSKRANFSGYVLDKNDQPIPNVYLDYCYDVSVYFECTPELPYPHTDSSGYFYSDDMFCRKYSFWFRYPDWDGDIISDSLVSIEPDSANYFVFKLDTLLTGIDEIHPLISGYSITNFPNPSSFKTTFIIDSKNRGHNEKGVIKIYSEAGFIVDIIPVDINSNSVEINYNASDNDLSAGMYFYNLEVRNKKVASCKMVIR